MTTTTTRPTLGNVSITRTYSGDEIYEIATNPFGNVSHWIHSISIASNNSVALVVKEDTGEFRNVALTPKDILDAFKLGANLCLTHCDGYPLEDLANADACSADLILQLAVFHDIVWG